MRTFISNSVRRAGLTAVLATISTAPIAAQLPNSSAAAFGMAGNFTAVARGYEAVSWNAANLAMPGRPFMSFGLASLGGTLGLDPVDFRALHEYSGQVVPDSTRAAWVDLASQSGGQKIRIDGGVTYLGLSVGPFGLQVGSSFYTNANLSPDAFEAVLFGNAGRTGGQAKALDFTGTSVRGAGFTTGAASFAFGLPFKLMGGMLPGERMALGVTGKYVIGHGLVLADDAGSTFGTNDIQLSFPTIITRQRVDGAGFGTASDEYNGIAGSGVAADISLAWRGGPWRVGVLAENMFNGFTWDTTMLAFLPGTGSLDGTTNTTDFDRQPFGNAPQALQDLVTAQKFSPAFTIGAAMNLTSRLTLTADMKTSTGGEESIVIGPRSRFGVGAELRILPFIPIRAGVASVTDGWQAGLGAGFHFLGAEISAATSIRRRGAATESGVMVGVLGLGR
ncbi:MAG: hypothetical protein ACRENU_14160 [Gemmatimonadaceae bacterium]